MRLEGDLDLAMKRRFPALALGWLACLMLGACQAAPTAEALPAPSAASTAMVIGSGPTPLPTRTVFPPGEIAAYQAQTGDTLAAIAAHFNTTVDELRAANADLPQDLTTLPAGYPLQVPAYYAPLGGTPFKILPDSDVVNGPGAVTFDLEREVRSHPGFLAGLSDYAFGRQRPAWEVVDIAASNYSVNPRLLLGLLEYQTQALSRPFATGQEATYPLGVVDPLQKGLYRQLIWAAERLNNGYYGWRSGDLRSIELKDGLLTRPDSWQNAGTVGVQNFFAGLLGKADFEKAVGPDGFYKTYVGLWGDPFSRSIAMIPGNLEQPPWSLPFVPNRIWDFTGGPHQTWGESLPLGALDFAPPAAEGGCFPSDEWIAAPAAGIITRSAEALVVLDTDGDGDDRTGWVIIFFHVATNDRVAAGTRVKAGDLLGHPSCEGGRATGTHFHIARRFNGEWIPAGGTIPFVLDDWVAHAGSVPYQGTLTRGSKVVQACTCSTSANRILYELK
jgi:LasA protease